MASKSLKLSDYLRFFCNFNFNPLTHQHFPSLNSTRGKSSIGLRQYPLELVRSFSAAHFNHGNSTQRKGRGQPHYFDESQVERVMGIMVKAKTTRMFYKHSINGDDCSVGKESPTFSQNPIGSPESCSQVAVDVDTLTRIINDHPFPLQPLHATLLHLLPPSTFSTTLVENVLGRLFSSHSNGLKALEFFNYCLIHSHSP
ncbi:hypothetical protein ACSQ67_008201 [Phaseolus vulgaris]